MQHDFVWRSSYSVGHRVLDQQHQELFRLCERASDCAEGRLPDVKFAGVINDLAKFAFTHIDYEESLLQRCGYAQLEEQKEDHLKFIATITDIVYAAMQNTADKSAVADYAWEWWKDHVLVSDMKYRDTVSMLSEGDFYATAARSTDKDQSSPSQP